MGNCCSDDAGGRSAVGGASHGNPNDGPNDAVDLFLKSRGYSGLCTRIEEEDEFESNEAEKIYANPDGVDGDGLSVVVVRKIYLPPKREEDNQRIRFLDLFA